MAETKSRPMNVSLSETGKNLAAKKWRLETTKAPALQVSGVALPDPSLSPRIYLQRLEQNLVWLVVGDERCTSQGFNLKIDSGIKKGTMGRILSASPTIAAPLSRAQGHRSRNAERFPPGFRSRCDRQGVPRF